MFLCECGVLVCCCWFIFILAMVLLGCSISLVSVVLNLVIVFMCMFLVGEMVVFRMVVVIWVVWVFG